MKGLFIPGITVEMFRNGCLESIEALMSEGKIFDIETDWAQVPVSEELKSAYYSGWVNAINYVIKHELFIEPKKGQWEEKSVFEDSIQEWQSARCSVCNKYHTTPYLYYFDNFNYCPNCGALMEEETE